MIALPGLFGLVLGIKNLRLNPDRGTAGPMTGAVTQPAAKAARARLRARFPSTKSLARRGRRSRRGAVAAWLCAVVVIAVALAAAGCTAAPNQGHHAPGAAAYWDRSRLLGARPFKGRLHVLAPRQLGNSHLAGPLAGLRVGALFVRAPGGNHFCTASVVASPGKDLLITAAHCINGGKGRGGYRSDIVFIPDYRDGQEPFGIWTPAKLLVAPQWADSSDPDYDVGFVVLNPHDHQNIEEVLGANRLGTDLGYQYLVHVTGYPASSSAPISCVNWTSRFSSTQLRFQCTGYTGGTSGSPWVTRFSPRSRTGTIVGVLGGYQEGGTTPSISYSARLGPAIQQLYRQAKAASVPRP
jgi:V8-like Glu-specific endopeptidase